MNTDILLLFGERAAALPLYVALEERILAEIENVAVKVQKTQIAFANRHNFAFVSFLPVRRARERPETWITVTIGLRRRLDSPRVDAATEPYPNRWTHHLLISDPAEIDDELMGWIREAAAFSDGKRKPPAGVVNGALSK